MDKEIERKFLLSESADIKTLIKNIKPKKITQGYAQIGEVECRVRKRDNEHLKTVKRRVQGTSLEREEFETPITKKESVNSLKSCLWKVQKKRYVITLDNNLKAELDVFEKDLSGLTLIEVEFKNTQQAQAFIAPYWFGEEVTDNKKYRNQNLAVFGNKK